MIGSSSSSSSPPKFHEFCIQIPIAALTGMVGAQVLINVSGRASETDSSPLWVHYEATDTSFNVGGDGQGFQITSSSADSGLGVPLVDFSMQASSLSFTISKASGGVKYPLLLNMFLWAHPNVGEIQLTGSISEAEKIGFGWEHNSYSNTMNFYQWIAWA